MTRSERLLIIGGTGRDSGKSSLATLLISRFTDRMITGVKITPHSHPEMSGLTLLTANERFQIYEEHNSTSGKDSARMLKSGASNVFLIVSEEINLEEAFNALQSFIPPLSPVICESPALRRFFRPDLFVIMVHPAGHHREQKNIDDLIPLSDLILTIREADHNKADIIDLKADGHWYIKR